MEVMQKFKKINQEKQPKQNSYYTIWGVQHNGLAWEAEHYSKIGSRGGCPDLNGIFRICRRAQVAGYLQVGGGIVVGRQDIEVAVPDGERSGKVGHAE